VQIQLELERLEQPTLVAVGFHQEVQLIKVGEFVMANSYLMSHSQQRTRATLNLLIEDREGIFRTSHRRATHWDQMIHQSDSQECVIPTTTLALRFSLSIMAQ
jgi:hypothetical protein